MCILISLQTTGTHGCTPEELCELWLGLPKRYLVFLKLLPLSLLQGSPALLGFKPLLLQPSAALLELLLPERLGLFLLLQPHCLLGRWGEDKGV